MHERALAILAHMSLFSFKKKGRAVALVDIGSASVGGAFAYYQEGEQPVIYYTVRVSVEPRAEETITNSMLRSLAEVERRLIEEGAPALHREVGSGRIDSVLVSVGAPWQDTSIGTRSIQENKPFTFTHGLLTKATDTIGGASEGRIESGRTVIATMLNGYETANPFGKKAKRADLVILSSTLEKEASKAILASLRRAFHTHTVSLTAFAPAAYAVFRDLYPHQKDFIVLDVSGAATDAAFVKRGLLAGVRTVPHGIHELLAGGVVAAGGSKIPSLGIIDPLRNATFNARANDLEQTWLLGLREVFTQFAGEHALPRMMFLLADEDARDFLKRILERSELRSLWLSDDPLSIVPIAPSHLAPYVKTRGIAEGDLFLALLALYFSKGSIVTDTNEDA